VAVCNILSPNESCSYKLGRQSRNGVIAHFVNQHKVTEKNNCSRVVIKLTKFIQSSIWNLAAQKTSLKHRSLIISPPSQDHAPEMPPVFLLHLETTAGNKFLLWRCLQVWGSEGEYMVKFTLIKEQKTSSKLTEGTKPSNQTKPQVTLKSIERFLTFT